MSTLSSRALTTYTATPSSTSTGVNSSTTPTFRPSSVGTFTLRFKKEYYYVPYNSFSTLLDFPESLMNKRGQEFSKSQLRISPHSHSTWLW